MGGLRRLTELGGAAADPTDYNLMHLVNEPSESLPQHSAIKSDQRLERALEAECERFRSTFLSQWDGKVEATGLVTSIGSLDRPISPTALETWATCPYQYFLKHLLRISGPPELEDDEMSALERGSLVHKILERLVTEHKSSQTELKAVAEEEFAEAEARGGTGYPLLWESAKQMILQALINFQAREKAWLGQTPSESRAELRFGPTSDIGEVNIETPGLGEVSFQGKIDRLDVIGNEVRVRDFKTGKPDNYRPELKDARTVANGQAMQLPIYSEAARKLFPEGEIVATYGFPLADANTHEVARYTEDDEQVQAFHLTVARIIGTARKGIFPATPSSDGDGQGRSNCNYCDFRRLCPTRRRQIWERKGRLDSNLKPFSELRSRAAIDVDENQE